MLRRIAEVDSRLARVQLLFGNDTPAGKTAEAFINALWNGRGALERKPEPGTSDALQASGEALKQLNEFTVHARKALQRPWRLGEN